MRLKEFIKEAGRNQTDEFGNSTNDSNAKRAETPDWLKKAGSFLANKIGLKEPVDLGPDAKKFAQDLAAKRSGYTGIDPVIRQQAGLPPATHQEIDAYVKANPPVVGGLTGRDGKPVMSGSALELERAAREAAPREFYPPLEKAAVPPVPAAGMSDAQIAANAQRIKTPREQGNYLNQEFDDRSFDRSPVAPGGSEAPRTKVAATSSAAVQGGADNRLSKFPAAAAEPAPAAIAAAVPTPVLAKTDSDQNAEKDAAAALAQIKANAGLAGPSATPYAGSQMGPGGLSAAPPPAEGLPVAVKDPLAAVDSGSLGRAANAGVAAAAPASTSDPEEFIRDKSDDKFDPQGRKKTQNKEPAVNGGINISPTVFAYAINMGLIQNGKLDIERIKKFQRSQNIKDDGIIGKDTSNAILSVGNAYQGAGTGRGNSGNPGGTPINVDEPKNAGYVEPLPGVKDSKGRQVWKKADGVLAGFDPVEHRMYRIGNIHKLMQDPNAGAETGNSKPQPIGKTNEGLTIYRYANGRFGAWDADNRKMIPMDAPSSQATVVKESADTQRMRFLAGLTGK